MYDEKYCYMCLFKVVNCFKNAGFEHLNSTKK